MHRSTFALPLVSLFAFGCAIRQPAETPPPPPPAPSAPIVDVPPGGPAAPLSDAPVQKPASVEPAGNTKEEPPPAKSPAPTAGREAEAPRRGISPDDVSGKVIAGDGDGKPSAHMAPPSAATVTGGISKEVLASALMSHTLELRACYQALLEKTPDAKGILKIDLTVGPKGDVSNAKVKVVPDSVDSAACVLRVVQKLQFPATEKGSELHVSYPFALSGG